MPSAPASTLTAPLEAGPAPAACYHCAEPVPAGTHFPVTVDGATRLMCCAGCQAVAQTILDAGLGDYYRLRTATAPRAEARVPDLLARARIYERPALASATSREAGEDTRETTFAIDGIDCAACAWLIERTLASQAGVHEAMVNFASHRARVRYAEHDTDPGRLLASIARLGYRGEPYDPARREAGLEDERRARLRRLGVAGLFGMQVMMLAVVLYAGDWWGMEPVYQALFRWLSLALTLPVVGYCAWPYFTGAARGIANGAPGMDLPVSLGLILAFAASVHATVTGAGHVYFDSVVMFTFLLLAARYLEFLARRDAWQRIETLVSPTPDFAHRLAPDGETELVPVAELAAGDRIRVLPGESIPADGTVIAGTGGVDESLLSGESRPLAKTAGDEVLAGSVNGASPLEVRVERIGEQMVVSRILALAESAWESRPRLARLADRAASVFVVAVVLIATGVGAWWWHADPSMMLPATVAVLVVTCPCALSLATPTALTAVTGALTAAGLVPARGLAVEPLARMDHVVFDKTGTLTRGEYRLLGVDSPDGATPASLLCVAAALERHSEHPVARALEAAVDSPVPEATDAVAESGCGISACVDGQRWWLGAPAWVAARSGCAVPSRAAEADAGDTFVLLASGHGIRGVLRFGDVLRDGARELVDALKGRGIGVSLYSGDGAGAVDAVADALGITDRAGGLLPGQKLERLEALRREGRITAMVGDGVNDAPVLAGAAVSVAMGGGAQAARASADFILVNERLPALIDAIGLARRARRTVAVNMAWAVGYNLMALPLAATGWIAPWMAALGMSLSSLLVIANSRRLGARRREVPAWR